jgi:hypothetical protein
MLKQRREMKSRRKLATTTTAFHGQTQDGTNIVMIDKLRVALMRDGNAWVAQGLEIDYAAEGSSVDDAKDQFQIGLMLTLRENIRVFGHIKGVLRVVPQDVWNGLMAENILRQVHSQVSAHKTNRLWQSFARPDTALTAPPVGAIDYYVRERDRVIA